MIFNISLHIVHMYYIICALYPICSEFDESKESFLRFIDMLPVVVRVPDVDLVSLLNVEDGPCIAGNVMKFLFFVCYPPGFAALQDCGVVNHHLVALLQVMIMVTHLCIDKIKAWPVDPELPLV